MKKAINNPVYQEKMAQYQSLIQAYPNGTPDHISRKASKLVEDAMNAIQGEQHPRPTANARPLGVDEFNRLSNDKTLK